MALVVQQPRGGLVELAVCDWCVRALRRLSVSSGGSAVFSLGEVGAPPRPAVLIMELSLHVQDGGGAEYVTQVYGRERSDGTWEGWLEFVDTRTRSVRQTGRETTQSKRDDVVYWATGLEPSYVTGAFSRSVPRRGP